MTKKKKVALIAAFLTCLGAVVSIYLGKELDLCANDACTILAEAIGGMLESTP